MPIEAFFDHICDLYHAVEGQRSLGYGINTEAEDFTYPEEPDVAGVSCHFAVNPTLSVKMDEPRNMLTADIKVTVPLDTDIRLNDKVVWRTPEGPSYAFTAKIPRNIRNHHKTVMVYRGPGQEAL